jgi:predicted choloylglycine hydrolase
MKVEWKDSNGQAYLHVEAETHYELGIATGIGLAKQIEAAHLMHQLIPRLLDTSVEEFTSVAREYLPFIPQEYQDEIRGLAEGASEASGQKFTFDELLVQALSLEVLYGRYNFDPHSIDLTTFRACTCLGAVNPDGSVVMGQNYDAPVNSGHSMAWVLHRVGDEPYVFSARLGGVPAMPVGKNEHGLAMAVNVIVSNATAPAMVPRFVRAREAFATCRTVQEAYKVMYENDEFPFSLNMLISDHGKMVGVQILPHEIRPNYVKDLLVQANRYDYVDWQKYLRNPDYARERHRRADHLLRQAYEENQGLTNEGLLDILRDSPIICRDDGNQPGRTIAFMTRESFGLGNPKGPIGKMPI